MNSAENEVEQYLERIKQVMWYNVASGGYSAVQTFMFAQIRSSSASSSRCWQAGRKTE